MPKTSWIRKLVHSNWEYQPGSRASVGDIATLIRYSVDEGSAKVYLWGI